jgi:hypothetical protein
MNSGLELADVNVTTSITYTSDNFEYCGAGCVAQLLGTGNAILQGSNFDDDDTSWITLGSITRANRLEISVMLKYGRIIINGPARVKLVASESVSSLYTNISANIAPIVLTQPLADSVFIGDPKTLIVEASGSPIPTYQWYRNTGSGAVLIAGAINATYVTPTTTLSGGTANNGDIYTCTITNSVGSVTTVPVTLSVTLHPDYLYIGTSALYLDSTPLTLN